MSDHDWKKFKPNRLVCPHCQYDGTTSNEYGGAAFYIVQDRPSLWPIMAVSGKATEGGLILASCESWDAEDTLESTTRLLCGSCNEEFPLPDGCRYKWLPFDEHRTWGEDS